MLGDMLLFNINEGYTEAILRSLRMSFLKEEDYSSLRNCNNMSDFKMVLADTDYGEVVQAESSEMEVSKLKTLLRQKLAQEINYLAAQSSEPTTQFLELMRHGFMIENIVNIIEGIKNKVDLEVLLKRADPLGEFAEMKNIRMVEGDDYADLYQTVLIDLPIGQYFHKFLEEILHGEDIAAIPTIMRDYKPEKIKNLLKKIWLGEFHTFCTSKLSGASCDVMDDVLKYESDLTTMQIIYNSIGNKELGGAKGRDAERKQYIHLSGYLYPGRDVELTNADDLNKLKEAVKPYEEYRRMLDVVPDPSKEEDFNAASKSIGSNQEHIKDPAHLLMSSSFLPGYEGTTPLSQSLERELKELGATYSYNDEIPPYSIIFLISDADTYKMSGAMYYVSPNNFNLTDIRSTLQELTEVITNKLPILLSLDSIREKVGVIQQGLQDRRTLHITELEYESLLNDCLGKYKIDYMELSGHWEVVNYIKDVTLALSNKRIKKGEMKKSKNLKFKVGGVNVLQETFVHQLTSIPGISENKARAIVKEYPTMDGLMKAFRLTGLFALQDISVVAKTGNSTKLGKKLAEKVFCYYTTENPADDIKEFGK